MLYEWINGMYLYKKERYLCHRNILNMHIFNKVIAKYSLMQCNLCNGWKYKSCSIFSIDLGCQCTNCLFGMQYFHLGEYMSILTHSPLKTIITLWLALSNKLLTWEILKKRGFQGPCICILCLSHEE